jgi:uncharacterized protein
MLTTQKRRLTGFHRAGSPPWTSALRREPVLARVGFGAIVLYLLDDAFFQPEPGRSAADHLAGGLVPVAIVLLVALLYPRLRPGLRGAVALCLGLLALAGGVAVPVSHLDAVGLSGDDFTALLAMAGGLTLAVVGASVAWRNRRLDESRRRRYVRRSLIAAAGVVLAFELVVPVGVSFVATHKARSPVVSADLGRPYEEVSFSTADGLRLAGWYVPSRNGAAVIVFPGRSQTLDHARLLARHGYGVLLFDRRGEGESEGDYNAFGWGGDEDLLAALRFLDTRTEIEPGRIGGLGLSVGGELLLETAAKTDALGAVVSEGAGYRSIREQLSVGGTGTWILLPHYAMTTGATAIFANEGPPPNLTDLVGRIAPRPVFLIYTPEGTGAEEHLNPVYATAAGEPTTVWAIPGADHTGGLEARPQDYERRVITFFDHALLRPGEGGRRAA